MKKLKIRTLQKSDLTFEVEPIDNRAQLIDKGLSAAQAKRYEKYAYIIRAKYKGYKETTARMSSLNLKSFKESQLYHGACQSLTEQMQIQFEIILHNLREVIVPIKHSELC